METGWDKVKSLSRVRLLATPWTAAHQAPPSMGFSRQEYWSGVPLPSLRPPTAAAAAAAAAKSLQSCLTLCDPIDGSPPGSPVPGILQARTLEWGAIVFSKTSYYSCLIPTSTEECWGHLPVPMVPRKGSVFSTVTPTPHPRLLTARPESCYGDSQESSEDPLTAPTLVFPPFPVRNKKKDLFTCSYS